MRVASTAVSMVPWLDIRPRHRQPGRWRTIPEQADAVGVGHPDVEEHEVGRAAALRAARAAAAFSARMMSCPSSRRISGEEFANADFVVNDENFGHGRWVLGGAAQADAESHRRFRLARRISPSCSSMIFYDGQAEPGAAGLGRHVGFGKARDGISGRSPGRCRAGSSPPAGNRCVVNRQPISASSWSARASSAFWSRLWMTWRSWVASPSTRAGRRRVRRGSSPASPRRGPAPRAPGR